MKINRLEITLPGAVAPRLSSKLESIAHNLARSATEFGITVNEHYPARLATIAFTNGILLGLNNAEAAGKLEEFLTAEAIPSDSEFNGLATSYGELALTEGDWSDKTNRFLRERWGASSDNLLNLEPRLEVLRRALHGVRAGLVVARETPVIAQKVADLSSALWVENRFLSSCLWRWSKNDWEPYWAPYVEFTAIYYRSETVERRVLSQAAAEVYPIAKALNDPWDLEFWAETGWSGGRNLVRNRKADCEALLKESSPENLQTCHELYQRFVLGMARTDGEVQIGKAALQFIGELTDHDLARSYCTGREPRRLVRFVYDFAFWMGVFSSYPLPTSAN